MDLSELKHGVLGCSLTLFFAMLDLSTKKCVPCSSKDMRPMTEQAANDLIPQVCG